MRSPERDRFGLDPSCRVHIHQDRTLFLGHFTEGIFHQGAAVADFFTAFLQGVEMAQRRILESIETIQADRSAPAGGEGTFAFRRDLSTGDKSMGQRHFAGSCRYLLQKTVDLPAQGGFVGGLPRAAELGRGQGLAVGQRGKVDRA